jgi:hypothetical protein
VLLALGPHTPLFGLARRLLPGFAGFRFPQRFLLWAILALCTLAAVALTALLGRIRGWRRAVLVAAIVGLTFADLWHLQRRQVPVVPVAYWLQPPASAEILSGARGSRIYTLGAEEAFVTAYHQAGGWEGNLSAYVQQRALLQPNSNALYGFASPAGSAALTPALTARIWGSSIQPGLARQLMVSGLGREILVSPALQRVLDAWSLGHVLSLAPVRGSSLAPEARAGWALIYVNATALPRARIAAEPRVGFDDAVTAVLASGQWDPAREVLLTASPRAIERLGWGGTGQARITTDRPTKVVAQTETTGPAWLVLADTWYPGWGAAVDGKPMRIYRANLCQRAVHVPGGKHTVAFQYRAATFQRGLVISLGALVLWLAAMISSTRRRPPDR